MFSRYLPEGKSIWRVDSHLIVTELRAILDGDERVHLKKYAGLAVATVQPVQRFLRGERSVRRGRHGGRGHHRGCFHLGIDYRLEKETSRRRRPVNRIKRAAVIYISADWNAKGDANGTVSTKGTGKISRICSCESSCAHRIQPDA